MNSPHCLSWLSSLLCLALLLPGCSDTDAPPLGKWCSQHLDCPEAPASLCDPESSRCVPMCSRDSDCAPLACRNGRCGLPPSANKAASCRVVPDFVLGHPGMKVRFTLLATDAQGEALVPGSGITWTALSEAVTGRGDGLHATFTLAAPAENTEAVEARLGNTECRARVTVLPEGVPPGQVRVLVTDEQTGRPLPGATVAVSNAAGDILAMSETNTLGAAWLPATGEVSLSVFHETYRYLTLAHYDTEKGSRDVLLPLRRSSGDREGGARGTFDHIPASGNILLGLSGLSMPAMGLDIRDQDFFGSNVPVPVSLPGVRSPWPIASGAYLAVAGQVFKSDFLSTGVASVCGAGLAGITNVEESIRAGLCGTRTSWAVALDLPLERLDFNRLDPAESFLLVLLQDANFLRRMNSSVIRDVQFQLRPTVPEDAIDLSNTRHHTPLTHDFQQVPLGFQLRVLVPPPPRDSRLPLDILTILGTTEVAGQGTVPLGLGYTPVTDVLKPAHLVRVNMAPAHHGLEGTPYRLMVIAHTKDAWNFFFEGKASSVLIEPLDELPSDPRITSSLKVLRDFLPIPEHGRFNFNRFPYHGLQGREFRLVNPPRLDDIQLVSVLFKSARQFHWMVLMDAAHATAGIRLPIPPSPFLDRTRRFYVPEMRATFHVHYLSTRGDTGNPVDLSALAEGDETDLTHLPDVTTATSVYHHDGPGMRWRVPDQYDTDPRIEHDAEVVLQIDNFRLSVDPVDDGNVLISFQGGTGCASEHVVAKVKEPQHEVRFKPPPNCRGNLVRMTATLVDAQNIPLSPPVSSTITVNIT